MCFQAVLEGQDEVFKTSRIKFIQLDSDTIQLEDEFVIIEEIFNTDKSEKLIRSGYIGIDGLVIMSSEIMRRMKGDRLEIKYRILSFNLSQSFQNIDSSSIKLGDKAIYIGYDYTPYEKLSSEAIFQSDQLDYGGSFTRGFSVGNSQSLVLNSNFDLQLSGDLGSGLGIEAAISDDNLPIQPEGNTQLLQEFDKVYIKIKRNRTGITAGDYTLTSYPSHFMQYLKKLKGLKVEQGFQLADSSVVESNVNYAITRGKFARNTIGVQEGNQGPYKLTGENGQRILKVLSGTERVYLDGRLLSRGFDQDYTIAYDRAELTFTTQVFISKDSRIIIDFEYADQNYVRSQYAMGGSWDQKNFGISINFYTEQDSKSTTGDIDLDSLDLSILAAAGDNRLGAIKSGVSEQVTNADEESPLYVKTLEPMTQDTILVYSTDPTAQRFRASFSEVGLNNGSYIIDPLNSINGRVYKYAGRNGGSFEPIIQLLPPESLQLLTVGTYYNLGKHRFKTELALSQKDLNRFSNINNDDNNGLAGLLAYTSDVALGSGGQGWKMSLGGSVEYTSLDFNPLNPYRNAEFNRDWDFDNTNDSREILTKVTIGLSKKSDFRSKYSFSKFDRSEYYQGNKQGIEADFTQGGFNINTQTSILTASTPSTKTQFIRPNIQLSQQFKNLDNWTLGAIYDGESNKSTSINTNNLLSDSYTFDYYKIYIEKPVGENFGFRLGVNKRIDQKPGSITPDIFQKANTANELQLSGHWSAGSQSKLQWNFISRNLQVNDPSISSESDKASYLGRLDYTLSGLKGGLRFNTSYELGSGQEAKSEYEYVRVPRGEGQYIWLDDGDNIEQINEFQLAPVQDTANFVRVTIFNSEFIRTNSSMVNQSLRITPRNFLKPSKNGEKNALSWLSKLALNSSLRLQQKIRDEGDERSFSPFSFNIQDTSLVTFQSIFQNSLYFNQGNPKYDIQLSQTKSTNKIVQITGFELSQLSDYALRLRYNLNRIADIIVKTSTGNKVSDSEFFNQNDYDLKNISVKPELNIRPTNAIRFIVDYEWIHRKNLQGLLGEMAIMHALNFDATLRKSSSSSLNTSIKFINVAYDGSTGNNLELAILDGLKNGKNFLWNFNFVKRLGKNLDLIVGYDGRKTGQARMIHTAKAQIKATF